MFKLFFPSMIHRFILRRNGFWDKLIFNKIQALLGGRVDIISTGSAPLEAKILDFMRCAFGCFVRFIFMFQAKIF